MNVKVSVLHPFTLNEQKDLIHDKVVLSQGFFTKIVMGDGKGVYKDSGQILLSNVG